MCVCVCVCVCDHLILLFNLKINKRFRRYFRGNKIKKKEEYKEKK